MTDYLLMALVAVGVGGLAFLDLIWGELRRLRRLGDLAKAVAPATLATLKVDLQGAHNAAEKSHQHLAGLLEIAMGLVAPKGK